MLLGFVCGFVTSKGRGVEGASVSTEFGISVTTLPGGLYLMIHPPGAFDMSASKNGLKPATRDKVVVGEGVVTALNFQLQK